ncbi:MAG: ArsR/SmtB family transcription factor [Lacipirellulaceae bacterium]
MAATNDSLSVTFAALADPTRRAILARLASGEATVTELNEPLSITMPAVTKHLKVLERAGLVERGRRAQWRPVRLKPAPLKGAAEWIGDYRQFWEASLDRLDAYLKVVQAKAAEPDAEAKPAAPTRSSNKSKPSQTPPRKQKASRGRKPSR